MNLATKTNGLNNENCCASGEEAPHIVIKLGDINFNFLVMTLIVFTPALISVITINDERRAE